MGNAQTLKLMETEFLYTTLSDCRDTASWKADKSPDIYEQAHGRVKEMLRDYPQYIPPSVDNKTRQAFDIRLAHEDMQSGNGRW